MRPSFKIVIDKGSIMAFVLNVILLCGLLPSYGIIIVSALLANWLLLFVEILAILILFIQHKYHVGIIFSGKWQIVLFCFYSFIVTVFNLNSNPQRVSHIYWISIVFIAFGIYYIVGHFVHNKTVADNFTRNESFYLLLYFSIIFFNFISNFSIKTASTAAASYYLLTLLPFVFCLRKKVFKILLIILVGVGCLVSLKRGAFIAYALCLLAYFYINSGSKKTLRVKRILQIAFLLLIGIELLLLLQDFFGLNIIERLGNIGEDGGSYRSYIYATVWQRFIDSPLEYKVFGRGFNAVRYSLGIQTGFLMDSNTVSAHNDFLEVLIDYGLIGAMLYISFVFCKIKVCFKAVRDNHEHAAAMVTSIIIFLMISLVSHLIIYPSYIINLLAFWVIYENVYMTEISIT